MAVLCRGHLWLVTWYFLISPCVGLTCMLQHPAVSSPLLQRSLASSQIPLETPFSRHKAEHFPATAPEILNLVLRVSVQTKRGANRMKAGERWWWDNIPGVPEHWRRPVIRVAVQTRPRVHLRFIPGSGSPHFPGSFASKWGHMTSSAHSRVGGSISTPLWALGSRWGAGRRGGWRGRR